MPLFNLTGAQYQGFLSYFNRNSRNGQIAKRELWAILTKRGFKPTNDELQEMIDAISVESSGISFQAFVDYCSGYTSLRKEEEEYLEAFRVLDSSGTGRLSKDDIKYVASKLGIVGFDADDVMAKIDTKQDGVIDYEEFVQMMKTTTSTQKKPSTEPGWGTPHLV